MKFEVKAGAIMKLFDYAKHDREVQFNNLQIIGLHEGKIQCENLTKILEEHVRDIPSEFNGTYTVNMEYQDGNTSSLMGFRTSEDKSIAEEVAEIIREDGRSKNFSIHGFMLRLRPTQSKEMWHNKTITKIFAVVE